MEISVDVYYSSDEDDETVSARIMRKQLRDKSCPLDLSDQMFLSNFRLNKDAFKYLLEELGPHMSRGTTTRAIGPIIKLATLLRFLSEGSYQKCCGNDYNIGLSQPSVSKVINELVGIVEQRLSQKWVQSQTNEEKDEAKRAFFQKTSFPGIIGCVHGTHIHIHSPKRDFQHAYLGRKGYHSINTMIVCDHRMIIRFVDARHPGSSHDSHVWRTSTFKQKLEQKNEMNTWVLGDAGYPLQNYIMTPFRMAESGSPKAKYNMVHSKTRNIVERTIGVLKGKFRCLLALRGLHCQPEKCTKIINTCCVLHNIAIKYKVPNNNQILSIEAEVNNDEELPDATIDEVNNNYLAKSIRIRIMQSL